MIRFKVTLKTPHTTEIFLVYALNKVHAQELVRYTQQIRSRADQIWDVTRATDRTKFQVSPQVI
jgi:predicted nucleotidyltransferase component of viral defense system